MSKSKRILLFASVALALLVGLAASGRVILRPALPNKWRGLRKGMTRDQVLAAAVGQHADMLKLKGFDVFTRETLMLGEPCYWQLHVTYDQTGGMMSADARFIHRRFGFLGRPTPQSVL